MRRGGGSFRRQGSSGGGGGSGRRFSTQSNGSGASSGNVRSGGAASASRGGGGGSGRRGGRRPQVAELSEREIRSMIEGSNVQHTVCLQLGVESIEPLNAHVRNFQGSSNDPEDGVVRSSTQSSVVPLAVFGLNDWEEQVEFERVIASLRRPTRVSQEDGEEIEATLECCARVSCDTRLMEWKYELSFSPKADDTMWLFANKLLLQLRSAGIYGRALLPMRGSRRVVLASAFSMASPFQDGSTQQPLRWSGEMAWHQIIVEAPVGNTSEIVQSVRLPAVPPPPTSSSESASTAAAVSLRYPTLVPLVEDLLSHNAKTKRPAVVILRGIPGSGKSTFGREIAAICEVKGGQTSAVRCEIISADRYFVGPRGYVFDVKSIGKAHDTCKQQFEDALRKNTTNIIVVDNTHTQLWEYEHYVDRARSSGCRVQVLEMRCPDLTTCIQMARRNSHGVPVSKVIQMHLRWELDSSALAFAPQFEHALANKNPISRSTATGVVYVGLFIGPEERAKLLRLFPPIHANVFGEHVTIYYRPTKSYVRNVEIGEEVAVRVTDLVQDERGQTLRVEFVDELSLKMRNKIPHITISTKADTGAYYSNELLEDSRANRIVLSEDQQVLIKAQMGVAVLTQNQRVTTLTSPFGAPESSQPGLQKTAGRCGPASKMVVVCIDEESLESAMSAVGAASGNKETMASHLLSRLTLHEQMQQHLGSSCSTRRILCLKQNGSSSSDTNLRSLEDLLLLSPSRQLAFDKLVVLAPDAACDTVVELLERECDVATLAHAIKKLTVLTTLSEHMSSSFADGACFQSIAVSVSKLVLPSVQEVTRSGAFSAPYALTLTGAMDCLNLGIQERTRHDIHTGIRLASNACLSAFDKHSSGPVTVERFDSSLVGLEAEVVDLCAFVDDEDLDLVELQRQVVEALANGGATHTLVGREPGCLYFKGCSDAAQSSVFRLQILLGSSTKCESSVYKRLAYCRKLRQQAQRHLHETETYATLVALLQAMLRMQCLGVAGDLLTAPILGLVSESLVLEFLLQSSEFKRRDVGESDESTESTDEPETVRLLQQLLQYLDNWSDAKWTQVLAAVQELFGRDGPRTQVRQSPPLVRAVKTCLGICRHFDLETRGAIFRPTSADKRSADLLQLLVALVHSKPTLSEAQGAVVRGYVQVTSSSNPLDTVALCDAMQQVALKEHVNPLASVFACAPSRLLQTQRIDVITASQEVLEQVIAGVEYTNLSHSQLAHLQLSVHC
ncbi:hypothetical protein Gpo141_00010809 [Globisporangium polare]